MKTINFAILTIIIVLVLLCSCVNSKSKVISKETSTGTSISSSDTQSNSTDLTTGTNVSQATMTTQAKTNTNRTTTTHQTSRVITTVTTATESPYNDPKVNETLGNSIGNILSNTSFCEINGYIYKVYAEQSQPYSLVIKRIKNLPNEKWEIVFDKPTQDLVGVYREMDDNYVQSFGNRIYFSDYSINSDGTDFKFDSLTGQIVKIGSRSWCYPFYNYLRAERQNFYRYELLGPKDFKYENISDMPYSGKTNICFAVNGWIYNGIAGLRVSYDLKKVQRISNSYSTVYDGEIVTYSDEWIYFKKNECDYYRCRPNFSNIQFLFKEIAVDTRANVSNGIMYYGKGTDFISYNIGTKKKTVLYKGKWQGLSEPISFGDYIYFNSGEITRINIKTLKCD